MNLPPAPARLAA